MLQRTFVLLSVLLAACTSSGEGPVPDGSSPGEDLPHMDTIAPSETLEQDINTADEDHPSDAAIDLGADAGCDGAGLTILRFGLAGDADEASVGAGEDVPFLLEWALSGTGDCPGCSHCVVLGVGGAATHCWEVGTPLACPDAVPGLTAGLLVAPGSAGQHEVEVIAIETSSCAEALAGFADAERLVIGDLTVSGACADPTCADWGPGCGTWENGCGGTCTPGPCADAGLCTGDGACAPEGACGAGIFETTDVFLNGQPGSADVDPGAQLGLALHWTLGNATSCPDCERQIVFGVAGTPVGCVDVGAPEACPSYDAEIFATLLDAPGTPGTWPVLAQAYTAYDCFDAEERFIQGGPKQAIGTLRVGTGCDPSSCLALGRKCGRLEDGCGGLLDCGGCAGSKRCTPDGQCAPVSTCDDVLFEVENLVLNGIGPVLGLEEGPAVALLDWRGGVAGESGTAQVVVGLGDQPAFCREIESVPHCDAPLEDAVAGFLFPPAGTGTFPVRAALLQEDDCKAASAVFEGAVTAGILRIGDECAPKDCADLGVECGPWGDGCGYPLSCGACQDGEDCAPDGHCGTACSAGIIEVDTVEVNNSGPSGSAAPGQQITVSLHWTIGNPDDCDGCERPLIIGIDDAPGPCTALGELPTCPETADDPVSVSLVAPTDAGGHPVSLYAPVESPSCPQAQATYAPSSEKLPVGTLHVTDGCAPKSCYTLGAGCGAADDGCGFILDCGECPPGDLCFDGTCACFAHDDYEPNDAPAQAFDLGTFPDLDTESTVAVTAMVDGETDWFLMGALDEMWAYVNPAAQVSFGATQPYTVQAVYICSDGSTAETDLTTTGDCTWTAMDFSGVSGLSEPVSGWRCQSAGEVLDIELSPDCPTMDDSGRYFVSVGTLSGCSSYDLELHL